MKKALLLVGSLLLAVAGIVWFLQGIDVLSGILIGGQIELALYGMIALVASVWMFVFSWQR